MEQKQQVLEKEVAKPKGEAPEINLCIYFGDSANTVKKIGLFRKNKNGKDFFGSSKTTESLLIPIGARIYLFKNVQTTGTELNFKKEAI